MLRKRAKLFWTIGVEPNRNALKVLLFAQARIQVCPDGASNVAPIRTVKAEPVFSQACVKLPAETGTGANVL
jgi:hypothetical protein